MKLKQIIPVLALASAAFGQNVSSQNTSNIVAIGDPATPLKMVTKAGGIHNAILAAGANGVVWIPANYVGADCNPLSSCNPGSTLIIDLRGGTFNTYPLLAGTGGNATGLLFGATVIPNTSTAPTPGQCIEYNGTGFTGSACSGGSSGLSGMTAGQVPLAATASTITSSFSLASGVQTFLSVPSSANLATAVTDETGTGAVVFANGPTLIAPVLGTPASGTLTNATGLPISTGVSGLGANVATFLGTPSSTNLLAALTTKTGTGNAVFSISPALTGTPDASGATQFKLPVASAFSSAANGEIGYDTINSNWHLWQAGVDSYAFSGPVSGTYTNGDCVKFGVSANSITLVDNGSACGSGGGGSTAWSSLTNGSGNLGITPGGTSAFNATTAAASFFTFNNTTAAVVGTSQGSPTIGPCGTGFHSSASVSICELWGLLPGNGNDAAITVNHLISTTSTGTVTDQFSGAVASGSDGVHAGAAQIPGNTTVPSLGTNSFSLIGPNSASFTAYGWQAPTAENGSAGLVHMGAASSHISALTVSPVTGSDMASNTVTSTQLAAQYSKGSCTEVWGGSGTSFALTSGDDAISNNTCYNDSGVTRTITAVKCLSDNGTNTTTVTPTFGSAGTGTSILSGALTCGNSNAYSSSGTVSNASWTTGAGINPVMGGTPTGTHIAMIVEYTF